MKRNRIIYLLLCAASIVLASFYGGPITYSIMFGLLLVAPISLTYLLVVYIFFKLYQVVGSKHITAYEPIPYYFVLQNEYLLNFCHISVSTYSTFSYIEKFYPSAGKTNTASNKGHDDGQQTETDSLSSTQEKSFSGKNRQKKSDLSQEPAIYELLPGESIRYDTTLICRYRGDYFVGIKAITIVDFFRLFKITYKVPEPVNAVVAPRIISLDSLRSAPDMTVATYRENPRLSTDFDAQVRAYIPGDPLKGIHWKSTAKTGKLQSRLTYGEQRQGISVFLDTKRISSDEYEFIPIENKCLEIILALTNYFSNFSVPTTFFYSQSEPRTAACSAPHEMDGFLSTVSSVKFRDDEDAAVTLDLLLSGSAFKDCIIAFLVITDSDAELNKRLYELSVLGIRTIIYYVGYNPNLENIMQLSNVRVIPVHPEDGLESVL